MLTAVHALIYAQDAAATRSFLRDVLGWPHVDAGEGWLIFALPPAEIGVHPTGGGPGSGRCELYLVCDDLHETLAELRRKGVTVLRPVTDQGWGLVSAIDVPGAGELGIYQPRHPLAAHLPRGATPARTQKPKAGAAKRKAPPRAAPKRKAPAAKRKSSAAGRSRR